ncbi:MAG: hypothetical protein CMF48_06865 [Legionellales bacterium]|nr:hypothetical protein [Legionellales bacterium]
MVLILSLFLSGCSGLSHLQERMDESYRYRVCSYDKAYALGNNDAAAHYPMRPLVAEKCPDAVQADVQQGYRDGYVEAQRNHPVTTQVSKYAPEASTHQATPRVRIHPKHQAQYECRADGSGEKVCGYNCSRIEGHWYCAKEPNLHCRKRGGRVVCIQRD